MRYSHYHECLRPSLNQPTDASDPGGQDDDPGSLLSGWGQQFQTPQDSWKLADLMDPGTLGQLSPDTLPIFADNLAQSLGLVAVTATLVFRMTVPDEGTFAGGFWGPNGVTGSDAAWRMVNGTLNSPTVALAHHTCGDGFVCNLVVNVVVNAVFTKGEGLVTYGASACQVSKLQRQHRR